jgi:hypothetical protein
MSAEFAGYPCPKCTSPRPIFGDIILGILEESRMPVAYDLECGCCGFKWRVIL